MSWSDPSQKSDERELLRDPTTTDRPDATVTGWCCTKCGLPRNARPDTILLGGYGHGRCTACEKRTTWASAELRGLLRSG